jgi:TctA family transporter
VGNTVCSQLAWRIEKYFSDADHHHHSLRRLTSAEAANNSSAIAVMLPLMMFGIPIVSSEVVLFSILQANGWMSSMVTRELLLMLAMAFLLSAVVSWILCGFNVQRLVQGISKYATLVVVFTLVAASFGVISTGMASYSGWFYSIILALAGIIGILGRRLDFTPLVLSFLVAPTLVTGISTLTQLYL